MNNNYDDPEILVSSIDVNQRTLIMTRNLGLNQNQNLFTNNSLQRPPGIGQMPLPIPPNMGPGQGNHPVLQAQPGLPLNSTIQGRPLPLPQLPQGTNPPQGLARPELNNSIPQNNFGAFAPSPSNIGMNGLNNGMNGLNNFPRPPNFPIPNPSMPGQSNPSFINAPAPQGLRFPQNGANQFLGQNNISISSSEGSINCPYGPQSVLPPGIITQNVGTDSKKLGLHYQQGSLHAIQRNFPDSRISIDDAGPGQNFVSITGPPGSVHQIKNSLRNIDVDSDSQWHYLHEKGSFEPYSAEHSYILEQAFSDGKESVTIPPHYIYFGRNGNPHTQVNPNTGIYRTVRRGAESSSAACDVMWHWSTDNSEEWGDYEPEACRQMESYYQTFLQNNRNINFAAMSAPERKTRAKKGSVLISGTSGYSYLIDFINMVQFNEETGRWRGIKRANGQAKYRISKISKPEDVPWIPHPDLH